MSTNALRGPQLPAEIGVRIGRMPSGGLAGITDVGSIRVGHVMLVAGEPNRPPVVRTGATAVVPHRGNLFGEKVEAAVHVINGFGRSAGPLQVMEPGEIECPKPVAGTGGWPRELSRAGVS